MKKKAQTIETNIQPKPKATWPQFTCPSEPTEGLLGIITNFAKELNQNTEGAIIASFYNFPGNKNRFRFNIYCPKGSSEGYNHDYSPLFVNLLPDGSLEIDHHKPREEIKIDTEEKLQLFLHEFARSPIIKEIIEQQMLRKATGIPW